MRKSPHIVCLLSMLCLATPFAQAELVVGNGTYPSQSGSGSIVFFADSAGGNVAPLRSLVPGNANPIVTANSVEFEPSENVLYVADFWGQAIRVYDARASGAAAPLRTMNAPLLGQVRAVRVDRAHDEMVAIARMRSIVTWPRLANGGNVNPIRNIPWGGNNVSASQLNNPAGIALNRRRGEIVVGDYKDDSAAGYPNRILIYSRLSDGSAATPLRVIEGPSTQLGGRSNVRVAVDEETQTIFAVVGPPDTDPQHSARVIAFAADAVGDATPLRVIYGPFASMVMASGEYPSGLGFDENSGHILVSIATTDPSARGRIVVHSRFAYGGAFPLAVLQGANTGFGSSPGTAAVTFDRIFKDGFDG
ncbi:MAG: hypothetical protein KF903_10125 [Dokdonella sp.]|uniref:hypothetical protein n=1 Tax=Dokdonella sp. TaxID=2291710 RepID=UPI0025C525EE|nr:hypothetical protein [Dokdonella sp.]MBX3701342.1 hypothetical protein [Dokdonella sp.]